uniref:Uncharacterized protein n=1 Tax=Cyanothece sp. (strain PCC 7425 / ATCC 29141) TaxID=395961 RepID=B8HPF1_CYAP4
MLLRRLSLILGLLFIVNFVLFWEHGVYLGGDAIDGRIVDGHYFVRTGLHGHFIEVTRNQYSLSRIHAFSLFLTFAAKIAVQIVAYLVGGISRIEPQETHLSTISKLWAIVVIVFMICIDPGDTISLPWFRFALYFVPLPFVATYIELVVQAWTPKLVNENTPCA